MDKKIQYVFILSFSTLVRTETDSIVDLGWLTGDLIAGITVGMVLVPQGMSYAIVCVLCCLFGLVANSLSADCDPSGTVRSLLFICWGSYLLCE